MKKYQLVVIIHEDELPQGEKKEYQQMIWQLQNQGWHIIHFHENLSHGELADIQNPAMYTVGLADTEDGVHTCDMLHIAVAGYEWSGQRLTCRYILQSLEEVDTEYFVKVYRRYHKMPLNIAETRRCLIREIEMDDMKQLFALYELPHMTDYMEPLYSWDEEIVYEKTYIEQVYGFYEYGMWVVLDKMSGRLIGRAGVEYRENCRDNEVEMGYAIASDLWGQGYGTEVCQAVLTYVTKKLPGHDVICRVNPQNVASCVLLRKLHFTKTDRTAGAGDGEKNASEEKIYQWNHLQ